MKIFFPGDKVRTVRDGHLITGVIEDFEYDLRAIQLGLGGDIALVRCTLDGLVKVPCADLEAVEP